MDDMTDSIDREIHLEIIQDNDCPLYELGDEFQLEGRILTVPGDKPTCLTLAGVIYEFVSFYSMLNQEKDGGGDSVEINCGGETRNCQGRVRLECRRSETDSAEKPMNDKEIRAIAQVLKHFHMFAHLDNDCIRQIITLLKPARFEKDQTIVKCGDPGVYLYIIIDGRVQVLGDNGVVIAILGKGDVFGEMSLISGEPVSSEVWTLEPVRVLYLDGKRFRKLLSSFPSLKLYFARLLARRLSRVNLIRSRKLVAGMTGMLSEMPPSELFQTINMNHKDGVLVFEKISRGTATVRFRDGELIYAEYGGVTGKDAFFDLLEEKSGAFKFSPGISDRDQSMEPVGDFMWLLMEGLNRLDNKEMQKTE